MQTEREKSIRAVRRRLRQHTISAKEKQRLREELKRLKQTETRIVCQKT